MNLEPEVLSANFEDEANVDVEVLTPHLEMAVRFIEAGEVATIVL